MGAAFDACFLALADPAPGKPVPGLPARLDPERLVDLADRHGVLPAVARGLRLLEAAEPAVAAALALAEERLLRGVAFALRLRMQLAAIAAALAEAGVPALVLKGPEFADRLYAEPALRPFTDLDFLLPREALGAAGAVLEGLAYRRCPEPPSKYPGAYGEEMWVLDEAGTGAVELHWDLVNSPALRRRCSVGFGDLALAPPGAGALPRATPASLLLIAAVHAAMSHRFDRLQPLADVCQAARGAAGPVDAAWLAEAASRTGSALALGAALRLAEALFREPACSELLARTPGLSQAERRGRWLLTPRAVLHSKSPAARARRQLFRELLKRR
ncbi:MAG TPA: nucleotidyltransferase family protein [Planctomycetota bacterium]|nr:nucleotidyltransferase family protein [Planctomycetota bacterium]HRR82466.1 nucleotidyltransferase family protein [Planctomycetota bacterium]HRT96597.1 nucleotidyltransferase family protein [Planctomycetota bacterium]